MMEHPCPLYIQKLSLLTEALTWVVVLATIVGVSMTVWVLLSGG
jgi:hypothetical protein